MRKFTSIALFLALFLPLAGTYSYLHLEKWRIRKEIKKQLISGFAEEQLVRFEFSTDEINAVLHWYHSLEFEYKGQMYDIVRQTVGDSSVVYWCYPDNEETRLNKQLTALVNQLVKSDTQRNEKQNRLLTFSKSLFCQHITSPEFSPHKQDFTFSLTSDFTLNTLYLSPPAPPPRWA